MALRAVVSVGALTAIVVGLAYAVALDYPAGTAATTGLGAGGGVALSYGLAAWLRQRI